MSERVVETDIAIVGAGPAGLAAASTAAESGLRSLVIDESPWLGGQIWRSPDTRHSSVDTRAPTPDTARQAVEWLGRFRDSGAALLDRTTVIAAPQPGVLLTERGQQPVEIRWRRLILATGARELFLPFPGWTLPGVMGPGGLLSFAKQGYPVKGLRVIIAGSGPLLLAAAHGLQKLGAKIVCIAEQAPLSTVAGFSLRLGPNKLWQAVQLKSGLLRVPYRCGAWPVRAEQEGRALRVTLRSGGRIWSGECDLLGCAFGLVPNTELALLLGCELANGFVRVDKWQATSIPDVYCAGEPTGIGGADCALVEGQIAGYAAAGNTVRAERLFPARSKWHRFRVRLASAFALRPEIKSLADDGTILCRCEDVKFGTVRAFGDWREAKLHSRCGMGPCQGRVCGAAARAIFGWGLDSARPPVLPASIGSLISGPALPCAGAPGDRIMCSPILVPRSKMSNQ